jgi:hypothetical protein
VKRRDEERSNICAALQADSNDPWPWASKGAAEYAMERYRTLDSLDRAIGLRRTRLGVAVKGGCCNRRPDAAREHLTRALI